MSTMYDRLASLFVPRPSERQPGYKDFFLLLAGAVLVAVIPMLGPVEFGDVMTQPSSVTAWIAFAIGGPAIVLLALKDPCTPLSREWRILWSAAFAAYLAHVLSGLPRQAPIALLGIPLSAILLALTWALAILIAWTRPGLIWPQVVPALVLCLGVLFAGIATYDDWRWLGAAFLAIVGAAAVARCRRLIKRAQELDASERAYGLDPLAPDIDPLHLTLQAWRDLRGKEVQVAATYSYLWLADQVGHFGLGMFLSVALDALIDDVLGWESYGLTAGFVIAAGLVIYWETAAYRDGLKQDHGAFPPDKELLFHNAVIAAAYMVLGTIAGWSFRLSQEYRYPILFAVAFLGIVAAKPWVIQKIIWQKASLPYLFRLEQARHVLPTEAVNKMQEMIEKAAPPLEQAKPQQMLLAGPIGSGRSMLASGIGTELAFRNKSVRYLSLDRLIEFAAAPGAAAASERFGDDIGPHNICYWPWTQAQVLIIDDIGPVLGLHEEADLEALLAGKLKRIQGCLAARHTIWVLGDLGEEGTAKLDHYADIIHRFCSGIEAPTKVLLGKPAS